jgi:hypothetical protein
LPSAEKRQIASEQLSAQDEQDLRNTVATEPRLSSLPWQGEWAHHTIIIVPKRVKHYYSRDARGTLKVLRTIIEKGSPHDALSAAGYALALAENPITGFLASSGAEDEFDRKNPLTGKTERQTLVGIVDKLISRLKARNEEITKQGKRQGKQ